MYILVLTSLVIKGLQKATKTTYPKCTNIFVKKMNKSSVFGNTK